MQSATSGNQDIEKKGFFEKKEDDLACMWQDYFTRSESRHLNDLLIFIGMISVACTSWLFYKKSNLTIVKRVSDDTCNFFYTCMFVIHIRMLLTIVAHIDQTIAIMPLSCETQALVETFLAVFEVEVLTHICIERYVVAKYITNGWPIRKDHYKLYLGLCFFFAFLYTIPFYYLGWVRYSKDFTCDMCTMDMFLPNTWHKYVITAIFLLRSVKPVIFMITMLMWARRLENKFDAEKKKCGGDKFTQMIIALTFVNLTCWIPLAAIRGWAIGSQLFFGTIWMPDNFFEDFRWAMVMYEISPVISAVTVFLADNHMLGGSKAANNLVKNEPDHVHQE